MSDVAIASGIIGVFGLLITLAYNKKSSKLAKHKMQKELFTEFNKRYDEINNDLNNLGNATVIEFRTIFTIEQNKKIKQSIYDFFNLCAEEHYWYSKKRIPKKVWISWEKGMNDIYNRSEVIQTIWEEECKDNGHISYYINKKDEFFKLWKNVKNQSS